MVRNKRHEPERATIASRILLSGTAELLKSLADVPSVFGHEWEVRDAITNALPAWAQSRARTDNEGNLILEDRPNRRFGDVHCSSG